MLVVVIPFCLVLYSNFLPFHKMQTHLHIAYKDFGNLEQDDFWSILVLENMFVSLQTTLHFLIYHERK
jgi:hypothetical protein